RGEAHRLLEEDLLAEPRREPGALELVHELGAHAAEQYADPARRHAIEEAVEDRDADRVGIARALHAQHDELGLFGRALLDRREVALERGGRAEEHLALEAEDGEGVAR